MKFSCEKSTLLDLISTASRAVSTKSAIPILEGILMEAESTLTLSGYDMQMAIRTSCDADIVEGGRVVVNAKLFGDIIRKLPSDIVYFDCNENFQTTIKCGRSVFNLIASSADDFPEMPEVAPEQKITIPQKVLKSVISQTIFAVSDNESKPIHTGCLFEVIGNQLTVVAVDGYRLSVRRETLADSAPEPMKFVVPGSSLREIERIVTEESDSPVNIYPSGKHILFEIGSTTLVTRLIAGEFLNFRAAIPTQFDHVIKVDRGELITCIERVSLIVSEKLKNPVRLQFDGDYIKMTCITALGKAYDECAIDGQIKDLEIGFNNRYLLDAVRAAGDEKLVVSLKGALNPIVISPVEGDKYTYLVLPVRLKANE